jgi:hypothetical protein
VLAPAHTNGRALRRFETYAGVTDASPLDGWTWPANRGARQAHEGFVKRAVSGSGQKTAISERSAGGVSVRYTLCYVGDNGKYDKAFILLCDRREGYSGANGVVQ